MEKKIFLSIRKIIIDLWKNASVIDLRGQYGCGVMAVTGNFEKRILLDYGVPEKRIVVIGNPKFDRIANYTYDKNKIYNKYGIPQDRKIVLWTTQSMVEHGIWVESQRENFTKFLISKFLKMPSVQLLIKHHPLEPIEVYKKILATTKNNAILCEKMDLYELINASDILLTIHSTTALEALMFKKMVVIVNLFDDPSYIPYVKSGACIGVRDIKKLPDAIKRSIHDDVLRADIDKKRESFIREHAFKDDGKASERAVEVIHRLMNESRG